MCSVARMAPRRDQAWGQSHRVHRFSAIGHFTCGSLKVMPMVKKKEITDHANPEGNGPQRGSNKDVHVRYKVPCPCMCATRCRVRATQEKAGGNVVSGSSVGTCWCDGSLFRYLPATTALLVLPLFPPLLCLFRTLLVQKAGCSHRVGTPERHHMQCLPEAPKCDIRNEGKALISVGVIPPWLPRLESLVVDTVCASRQKAVLYFTGITSLLLHRLLARKATKHSIEHGHWCKYLVSPSENPSPQFRLQHVHLPHHTSHQTAILLCPANQIWHSFFQWPKRHVFVCTILMTPKHVA